MLEIAKRYLEHLKDKKNYITHSPGCDFAHLMFGSGAWQSISLETFRYMQEEKLIFITSNLLDKTYIYKPTHKGFNHHLAYKNK